MCLGVLQFRAHCTNNVTDTLPNKCQFQSQNIQYNNVLFRSIQKGHILYIRPKITKNGTWYSCQESEDKFQITNNFLNICSLIKINAMVID